MALRLLSIDNCFDPAVLSALSDLTCPTSETIAIKFNSYGYNSMDDWYNLFSSIYTKETRHFQFDLSLKHADWWEISNQPSKESSYAYSTTQQPFHNDNAWFSDPAEINLFYMKKQVPVGGEQLFYPVSRLLNDLQHDDPSLLQDLLNTPVTIKKGDECYENKTPILTLQDGGHSYWNYYRTVKDNAFIHSLCDRFFDYLSHKWLSSSVIVMKMMSGDTAVFDDRRTLHARNSFLATEPYQRVLFQSMWRINPLS